VDLDEFRAMLDHERPAEIAAEVVAGVRPPPWVTRHGSGAKERARMKLGDHRYERRHGDEIWTRVDE
jgi:hypothetical protein